MKLKTSVVSFDAHVPPGVKCLQYSKMTKKMYSVHVDNSVVKWDASFAFVTEVFIPPSEDELLCAMLYNNEISADITDEDNTVDDTVLIGSSSGRIHVCNFNEMKLVEVEQTFGGAVIAFKQCVKNMLAVITQDKLLRIYTMKQEENDLNGNKRQSISLTLLTTVKGSKQSPEALCCIDSINKCIVVGSVNVLVMVTWKKLSQISNNECSIDFFTVPKDVASSKTPKSSRQGSIYNQGGHADVSIRSILLLDEVTCVTGDNVGRLMWWDLSTGTVMQTIKSHQASVTSLVSDRTGRILASGVDPYIVTLRLTEDEIWAQSEILKSVQSEVTSMISVPNREDVDLNSLVIGTKAPYVYVWNFHPDRCDSFVTFTPHYNGKVANSERKVLISKPNSVFLHSLGDVSDDSSEKPGIPLKLESACEKLIELTLPEGHVLISSDISNDAKWLCYASCKSGVYFLKLFQIANSKDLQNVPLKTRFSTPVKSLMFARGNTSLTCVFSNGSVLNYNLKEGGQPERVQLKCQNVIRCEYSFVHDIFAVICGQKEIRIFSARNFELICELPVRDAFPAAVTFANDDNQTSLFVQYSDFMHFEFDFQEKRYKKWCKKVQATELKQMVSPSIGSTILTFEDSSLKVISTSQSKLNVITPNNLKRSKDDDDLKKSNKWIQSLNNFKVIRNCCKLSENEIVLFVLPVSEINNVLPAGFTRKAFGT